MDVLPIPPHFDPSAVSSIRRVDYESLAVTAAAWAVKHNVEPAASDGVRTGLFLIDCQNTFCVPEFELFVGGSSGTGAIDDNRRLCEFLYRNLGEISAIIATLDTHSAVQIFHPVFWVDAAGQHPVGGQTIITRTDIETGAWRVNPSIIESTGRDGEWLTSYAIHYAKRLDESRSPLMIWPYHAMLGGLGHALVASVEEAVFFHGIARQTATRFEIKGRNRLTENYSALAPEVVDGPSGENIAGPNVSLIESLLRFDRIFVAGQAKSHCVAWTVQDLLEEFRKRDAAMIGKVYLLEDCTSPVVVPEVVDFSETAASAFDRFREAGMHVVRSTDY